MRIPCTKCGTEILEVTANANSGLCGPCARGAGFCVVCGERVWEANTHGEFIHIDCALKRKEAVVAASSGVSWTTIDEIDWGFLETGILEAIRNSFRRIGVGHPNREVREVVVAYRICEGIQIEPCVTFSDGSYVNGSLADDVLLKEIDPFDRAVGRIEEFTRANQSADGVEFLHAKIRTTFQAVFNALEEERFGLTLGDKCTKTLKDF